MFCWRSKGSKLEGNLFAFWGLGVSGFSAATVRWEIVHVLVPFAVSISILA